MTRLWLHPLIHVDPNVTPIKPGQSDEDWYYSNRKDDLHSCFTHFVTRLHDGVGGGASAAEWVGGTVANERDLLAKIWDMLYCMDNRLCVLAGWKINDLIWPKLVNRSIHHGLEIPSSWKDGAMDPRKKFADSSFYDLYTVYKQGIYGRPDIELCQALELWTREGSQTDYTLSACHTGRIKGVDIVVTLDRQIALMERVASDYDKGRSL